MIGRGLNIETSVIHLDVNLDDRSA